MRPRPRRAEVDSSRPKAWATCDRCGFILNHSKLHWQFDWRGAKTQNLRILVCETCLDIPQRQLGVNVLPPDPVPIMNARPEQYAIDEQPVSVRTTVNGSVRIIFGHGAAYTIERIVSVPGNFTAADRAGIR